MTEEPTLKLYALSVAAIHMSEPPQAIGIKTALAALPEGVSAEEAGLQVAQQVFPASEGWGNHYATATEITQGFPLAPSQLVWRLEKSE
jgi:hypothetical protein